MFNDRKHDPQSFNKLKQFSFIRWDIVTCMVTVTFKITAKWGSFHIESIYFQMSPLINKCIENLLELLEERCQKGKPFNIHG